eukprot:4612233-Amphidinium_carterae.1
MKRLNAAQAQLRTLLQSVNMDLGKVLGEDTGDSRLLQLRLSSYQCPGRHCWDVRSSKSRSNPPEMRHILRCVSQ